MNYERVKKDRSGIMQPMEFAQEVYNGATTGHSEYRVYAGTQTPLSDMAAAERVSLPFNVGV
jgi:hypothetical protein